MALILRVCRQYGEGFPQYPHRNLFLYGAPGLGKTFLSACIARTVAEKGCSVVYDTAANVFARFEEKKFLRYGEEARQAGEDTRRYLACDLLILDEILASCNYGMVRETSVVEFLQNRPEKLEVVLTGRNPSETFLELADYVSEICMRRHPYEKGIPARRGIEF